MGHDFSAELCQEDNCERLDVHKPGDGCMIVRRRESAFRTRSRKFAGEPWRAYCHEALRDCVLGAVSSAEPRNFSMIFSMVESDYGSCCDRTVHRHLAMLRSFGKIVRMDFDGRIHAYLLAGSRLLDDPDYVYEQIIDLHQMAVPSLKETFGVGNRHPWQRKNGGICEEAMRIARLDGQPTIQLDAAFKAAQEAA